MAQVANVFSSSHKLLKRAFHANVYTYVFRDFVKDEEITIIGLSWIYVCVVFVNEILAIQPMLVCSIHVARFS